MSTPDSRTCSAAVLEALRDSNVPDAGEIATARPTEGTNPLAR